MLNITFIRFDQLLLNVINTYSVDQDWIISWETKPALKYLESLESKWIECKCLDIWNKEGGRS